MKLIKSKNVYGEKKEIKRGRSQGKENDKVFGGNISNFLLLRDQATYKRRFEEVQGKKSNPNFIFL